MYWQKKQYEVYIVLKYTFQGKQKSIQCHRQINILVSFDSTLFLLS